MYWTPISFKQSVPCSCKHEETSFLNPEFPPNSSGPVITPLSIIPLANAPILPTLLTYTPPKFIIKDPSADYSNKEKDIKQPLKTTKVF